MRVISPLPTLCHDSWSQIRVEGHTWGHLWKSCWSKITSRKGTTRRLLLAHLTEGCTSPHSNIRLMSQVRKHKEANWKAHGSNHFPLAFHPMGNRHNGSTTYKEKTDEIPSSGNWLLHKIGRSKTTTNNYKRKDPTVFLEKHNLQVWNSRHHYFW